MVVPKTYVPDYNEFYETRWFASAKTIDNDYIRILGETIPIGTDLIFKDEDNELFTFAIEICEDLWTPIPPSSIYTVNGANLVFNLSASNELVGKHEYRESLVKSQSGRCICGYVYASSGVYESSTDVVFGGHAIIAEYGSIVVMNERFVRESELVYADIDLEKLTQERIRSTTFFSADLNRKAREIIFAHEGNINEALERPVDKHPFVPASLAMRDARCKEIFNIQTSALAKRLSQTMIDKAVIGISEGLDSTLALLVTVKAFDALSIPRSNIKAITMPGFGTTGHTYNNALKLMEELKVNIIEVDIKSACLIHFKDIGHDADIHDITYENVQARERTQVLMDYANKIGGLVIGTGDLSELALGWCTYNGDHMSMYAVNCGIPKTLVKYLGGWVAVSIENANLKEVLHSIIDTPISPELLPPTDTGEIEQKTEDKIGPYELHDFFIYHMLRFGQNPNKILMLAKKAFKDEYTKEEILKWLKVFYRRFFSQQFKRSCMPDGPKVGTISLSPRGDLRMPSDASVQMWLKELDKC